MQEKPIGTLSILIPLYNEVDNIFPLFERLQGALGKTERPYEVIVIDDGSTDGTLDALIDLNQKNPKLKIISFTRNFGQTAALSAGIDACNGDIIIPMDGDLQNDSEDILLLLQKIDEGYDVVSGWRKDRKDPFWTRRLPSTIANKMISLIGGVPLHDYGCTLKAYRKDILKNIRLYGEMHRFIPIYAKWVGARVTEIPVQHLARKAGSSKYGMSRVFKVILDLMVVKFLMSYSQKPIYVFGGIGLLMVISAFLSGGYALYLKLVKGVSFILTPLPLLSVLLLMLGFLSILMGFLAEIMTRTYYESQGKPTYHVKETIP
ncbi:MAG: glycosyltransferase family 2 protein [Deltaproteobacteria bacterium]|nr:glycosyltransferase family 2 protein [Deltaproteobacteria bacterium]MBM4348190.1 glycosyltransferase family 2 protein [Deltaproteobacteria bacterium]